MDQKTSLVWLRNDLRVSDNPALAAACKGGGTVHALYIHETDEALRAVGGAGRWWLHHSLESLGDALGNLGIKLLVRTGKAGDLLEDVIAKHSVTDLHWNRRYAPAERELDQVLKAKFRESGLTVVSHVGNVLAEPWTIETGQGKPYSVFSPF